MLLPELKKVASSLGIKAVSYTHLDVYKRQGLPRPRPVVARGVRGLEAVSYTHLDVYKRQDVNGGLYMR